MKKIFRLVLMSALSAMVAVSMTGCYFWEAVEPHQFAILSKDGVTINQIVGEGRYTDNGYRAEIHILDGQGKTLTWKDSELLTSDRQTIGFEVSVTYARDISYVELMWSQFRTAAQNDEALAALVESCLPRVVKAVTSSMTLDEMLERSTIQATLRDMLTNELHAIGLKLMDVGVNNIRPTEQYLALLEQRATITAEEELAQRRNTVALSEIERNKLVAQGQITLAQQQLELEKAETNVALELARRENLVAEEAKVYEASPKVLQIRLAEIYAEALKGTTTVYLPVDTALNIFSGNGVPVITQ